MQVIFFLELAVPGSGDARCSLLVFLNSPNAPGFIFTFSIRIFCLVLWMVWLLPIFVLVFSMPPFIGTDEVRVIQRRKQRGMGASKRD